MPVSATGASACPIRQHKQIEANRGSYGKLHIFRSQLK